MKKETEGRRRFCGIKKKNRQKVKLLMLYKFRNTPANGLFANYSTFK